MTFRERILLPGSGGSTLSWVLLLTALCWLPYFASSVVPVHDSLYLAENFHIFYSDLAANGEFLRWIPYGNYGLPADHYQIALSPTQYAVGGLGLICGVKNTLVLVKLAMLLNELLFACGLFLLSRELYSLRLTQFVVSLGGALSVSWLSQSMFNFAVFYLLPLVMWQIVRFFKTANPSHLYAAGIIEVGSLLGNVPYIPPIHFWVLAIFTLPLALAHSRSLKALLTARSLCNPWLWVLLASAACVGLFFAGAAENLEILSPGRDPATGRASLETFLTYGRQPILAPLSGLMTGGVPLAPNSYYVGLLPLAMFAYALITVRHKAFLGIAAACAVLTWFSFGGWFTRACYFLPGMSLYRHVSLVYGIISMLLVLGGGFGFDRLGRRLAGLGLPAAPDWWLRAAALIVPGYSILYDFVFAVPVNGCLRPQLTAGWETYLDFRIVVYAAGIVLAWLLHRMASGALLPRICLPALVLATSYLIDIGSFRWFIMETAPAIETETVAGTLFKAEGLPYLDRRSRLPTDSRGQAAIEALTCNFAICNNARYSLFCSFAWFDPCRPVFRTDLLTRGVFEMIRARGGQPKPSQFDKYLPAADDAFARSLGDGVPKMRLTDRAIICTTDDEAEETFAALVDPDHAVVLSPDSRTEPESAGASRAAGGEQEPSGTIEVTGFTPNRVQIRVLSEHRRAVWLVYADAWHPGWQARVDGRAAKVHRANLGFKAVKLDSGAQLVEFIFVDRHRTILAHLVALFGTLTGAGLCGLLLCSAYSPSAGIVIRHPARTSLDRAPGGVGI